jgi:hypothetical protein
MANFNLPTLTLKLPSNMGEVKVTIKDIPEAFKQIPNSDDVGKIFREIGDGLKDSSIEIDLNIDTTRKTPSPSSGSSLGLKVTDKITINYDPTREGHFRTNSGFVLALNIANNNTPFNVSSANSVIKLEIGELGVGLALKGNAPSLEFFARKGKATINPDNAFLKLILGQGITLDFAIEAELDRSGKLYLKNGTGLKASLPVPSLPTGPFQLQLIHMEVKSVGEDFRHLQFELSASLGVELGPFKASVDRLGMLLDMNVKDGRPPSPSFGLKPPNGIGLSLDAGIVKGGGYLYIDAPRGEYAGVLELKMLAIGVKAIALLTTQSEAGFSLLLLIYGQFPPIQLSFGFTLTGIGGLIGVQHTVNQEALSKSIGNGGLDAVLFPANPAADAPKIFNTLRTLFPVKKDNFVIGPMLELGWGTPSLVTVRMGLLIEANQFSILGQVIVQLPPAVSADLALLYLRLDFVGHVKFSPLRIAFDAKLINSRVAFISITGQFAFRADFGDNPTFLISAGGFHPRFKEIPSDIPAPFERVGASLDIGIIGVSFQGYFAVTSATVQAGAHLRVWADIGIASIEGGFGFDAICYLRPKFYFELDIYAYLSVHVFGINFAAIRLSGTLAGPGRWHIAATANVETPWPFPDFSIGIDEAWGTDRETPEITTNIAVELAKEINKVSNWSAQLPKGGEGYLTLADCKPGTALLAHPLGSLVFQQKLIPLELRLSKASGSNIIGANEFSGAKLVFPDKSDSNQKTVPRKDYFSTAQFFDLSQDEKLAKPSFESYTSGYELNNDAYDCGQIEALILDYEVADLGEERTGRSLSKLAFSNDFHGPMMSFGAAGLSNLRDPALNQPLQLPTLEINPPPLRVVNKANLQALDASSYSSVFQADQAHKFNSSIQSASHQVAELAELSL